MPRRDAVTPGGLIRTKVVDTCSFAIYKGGLGDGRDMKAKLICVLICGYLALVHTSAHAVSIDDLFRQYRAGALGAVSESSALWPFDDAFEANVSGFAKRQSSDLPAAAFLLEYSESEYRAGRLKAPEVFDEALGIAQRGPAGTPFDRAWHLAALALVEGRGAGLDLGSAQATAGRAADLHVFPGDKRSAEVTLDKLSSRLSPGEVALSRATLREQIATTVGLLVLRTFQDVHGVSTDTPDGRPGGSPFDTSPNRQRGLNFDLEKNRLHEAIDLFKSAEAFADVRAEAALRRGGLLAFIGEHEAALRDGTQDGAVGVLSQADVKDSTPRVRYLSFFLRGRFLQARGDLAGAERYYSQAAEIFPSASSVQFALANVRFIRGSARDEGPGLIGQSGRDMANDPWLGYKYGAYSQWADRIKDLRTAMLQVAR